MLISNDSNIIVIIWLFGINHININGDEVNNLCFITQLEFVFKNGIKNASGLAYLVKDIGWVVEI